MTELVSHLRDWEPKFGTGRTPENFRGDKEGYFPHRLVEQTKRIRALSEIIKNSVQIVRDDQRERVAQRLFDLVVYNAYGNVFPPVNSAGDAIGVPDEAVYGDQFKNSVSLIVRKDGYLAPAGGFNDMGENLGQSTAREHEEEVSAKLNNPAIITELSRPERDSRFTVVSMVVAGTVDPNKLHASDDAGEVWVVPLVDDKGNLNVDLFRSGRHKDVNRKKFSHKGMFAGHDETLRALYEYWQKYGRAQGLTLSQTIKEISKLYPKEWFEGYSVHPPGTDKYKEITINGKVIPLTPNVMFVREKAAEIFSAAGITDADNKALDFIVQLVDKDADILPKFPQPSVTTDVLALTPDNKNLWVIKMSDDTLRLPGSFYSPEHRDVGKNLREFAVKTVQDKLGTGFKPEVYLGAIGGTQALGKYADTRYPRISHIFAGTLAGTPSINTELYPEGEAITIPIYGPDGQLSPEMKNGTWVYDHGTEIVKPLIDKAIALREL